MAQMKRNMMNTIRAGKPGSGVRKSGAPARMFRPGNPKPVVQVLQSISRLTLENAREQKDRIVGD